MSRYELKHARTCKGILDAFETLIEEKTFEEITITAIAEQAGITRGTVYNHYPSIYHVLGACLQRLWDHERNLNGAPARSELVRQTKSQCECEHERLKKNPKLALLGLEKLLQTPYMYFFYEELEKSGLRWQNSLTAKREINQEQKFFLARLGIDVIIRAHCNALRDEKMTTEDFGEHLGGMILAMYSVYYEIV